MNKLKEIVNVDEDSSLRDAYQTYSLLKKVIEGWQEERGSFWMDKLSPLEIPPYYPLFHLPGPAIIELWLRLTKVMGDNVSESVLRETWENLKLGHSIPEVELLSTLQLALAGIAQLARLRIVSKMKHHHDDRQKPENNEAMNSEDTNCPVCGEKAILSLLIPPHGKRLLHCCFCGHEWPTMRIGCILCGRDDAISQNYLQSKDYPGVELITCETCGQYFKEFDLRLLAAKDLVWEDVRTLPLNYAGEQWIIEHVRLENRL
jgi:FdhE protein